MVLAVFSGISLGIQPLISRAFGSGRHGEAARLYQMGQGLALLTGAGVWIAACAAAPTLVSWFNGTKDALLQTLAEEGMRIYFTGFLFVGCNYMTAVFLSATEGVRSALPSIGFSWVCGHHRNGNGVYHMLWQGGAVGGLSRGGACGLAFLDGASQTLACAGNPAGGYDDGDGGLTLELGRKHPFSGCSLCNSPLRNMAECGTIGEVRQQGGKVMAETQKIVILDFGGQYTQLIARRVRECKVYSEVLPYHASVEQIRAIGPKGIILSGGPASVLEKDAPRCDLGIWELGVPVLGICYGMQLTAHLLGGTVEKAAKREYGRIRVTMDDRENLLKGMSESSSNWMSHTYQVKVCPPGFHAIAHAENCPVAAMANPKKHFYGVQFHPEVTHSEEGKVLLHTFLRDICGCAGDWTMEAYAQTAVRNIREAVGETGTVLLALSGGVDSSVARR